MDLLDESLPSDSTFLAQSMQRTMRISSYAPTYPAINEESYEDDFVDYYRVKFISLLIIIIIASRLCVF